MPGRGRIGFFSEALLKTYPSGNVMRKKQVLIEKYSSGSRRGYRKAKRSISRPGQ